MKSEKTGGVYVSFFSSQTGKCRSVKPMYPWYIGSVGATCFTGGEPPDAVSACTSLQILKNACIFERWLPLREDWGNVIIEAP